MAVKDVTPVLDEDVGSGLEDGHDLVRRGHLPAQLQTTLRLVQDLGTCQRV